MTTILFAVVLLALGLAGIEEPMTVVWIVAVMAAPVVLYYFFAYPLWALAVTNAVHAYAIDLGGAFVSPYKIAMVLAIMAAIRGVLKRGHFLPMPRGFTMSLLIFAGLVVAGEIFAEYESSPLLLVEFASSLFTFFMASQLIEKPSDGWVFAKACVVNLLIVTVTVVREGTWSALDSGGSRASGIIGQPNALGIFAANVLPFALALLLTPTMRLRWRTLGGAAVLASVYCQWAAASRGGSTAAIIAAIAFAWLAGRTIGRRVFLVLVMFFAINLAVQLAPQSFSRVTSTFTATAEGGTLDTSERGDHVALAMEMFPRHPWLGQGSSAFGYERSRTTGSLGQALHSAIFSVLVGYGIFAGILFLALPMAGVYLIISRRDKSTDRLLGIAVAVAVTGAFAASITGSNVFGSENWSNIALCYILTLRTDEARKRAALPASA
jgi:O-antigen ligase